jgi:hypothetical protein
MVLRAEQVLEKGSVHILAGKLDLRHDSRAFLP